MNLGVATALILLITIAAALMLRGRKTPAAVTALVFGLVVVALTIGATAYKHDQENTRTSDRREAAAASTSAAQRAFDAQLATYGACVAKVATRTDIRTVLFAMVDLSDLFPGSPAAQQYTSSRVALIDVKYPALDVRTACGEQPTAPSGDIS